MENYYVWIIFNAFVLMMLALDLGVFHRKAKKVGFKEALTWSAVWVVLALSLIPGYFIIWVNRRRSNFLQVTG